MGTEYVGGRLRHRFRNFAVTSVQIRFAFSKVFTLGSFRYGVYFHLIPLNARRDSDKMLADKNKSGFARTGSREITRLDKCSTYLGSWLIRVHGIKIQPTRRRNSS